MAQFHYIIQDQEGKKLEGILEAVSEGNAHHFLVERHYVVLELKPYRQKKTLQDFFDSHTKMNPAGFIFFVRQLATLLKAGVPMLTALLTLRDGIKDPLLKQAVNEMYLDIEKGCGFSESAGRHPQVFNYLFIATVRSGEAIGELDTVLLRLAEILERDYQTSSKIKSAMRYPILAFSVMCAAFLATTLFIIPRFKTLFSSFGGQMPLPTRILLNASEVVTHFWYIVLLILTGLFFLFRRHYRTNAGRLFWDGLVLRSWLIGPFISHALFSRFARMLGMMLKSGVNILQALELIAEIVGNEIVRQAILRVREKVSQGSSMGDQMANEKIFSPLIVQIVRVGEESGKMDELLLQISGYYDSELDIMAKNIESLIEPFFILMLGVLVMVLALGIFLPMWNIYDVMLKAN